MDTGVADGGRWRLGRILWQSASGSSTPLARWTFAAGWPASLVFNDNEEELVIVHGGLVRGDRPAAAQFHGLDGQRPGWCAVRTLQSLPSPA